MANSVDLDQTAPIFYVDDNQSFGLLIFSIQFIGVAPIPHYTHVRDKIVTLKGAHQMR